MSAEVRARVVAEALSWLGTPYRHAARVRGGGVDCAQLVTDVYEQTGVVPKMALPYYPKDWSLHCCEELWLAQIGVWGFRALDGDPWPGDLVLWKFKRAYNHAALVIEWPLVVHAVAGPGVTIEDAQVNARMVGALKLVFSPWGDR